MKKILVPTDFSENAKNALDHAIKMAKEYKADLIICSAFSMPYTNSSVIISMTDILRENTEEDLANLLDDLKKEYDLSDINVETEAVMGEVQDMVRSIVRTEDVDLVVMGTKGASGVRAALFGSNTASVIKKLKVPLLTVPEHAKYKPLKDIVFATDYKLTKSKRPLKFLAKLVDHYNAKLTILNVRKDEDELPEFYDALEAAKDDLNLDHIEHDFNIIDKEDVEEGINEHIKEYGGDMVAMVAKNYGFIERLFHRSLTKQVALHTQIPLLALHEDD